MDKEQVYIKKISDRLSSLSLRDLRNLYDILLEML